MRGWWVIAVMFALVLPALGQQSIHAPIASNYPSLTPEVLHRIHLQAVVHIQCMAMEAARNKAEQRAGLLPTVQLLLQYAHGYCDNEEITMENQDKDPHTLMAMVELTEQLDRAAGDVK